MKRLFVTAVLILAACTPGSDRAADIVLSEFSIDGISSLDEGASTISISNEGEFGHTVVIADESGRVVAATGLIPGGETSSLDVTLPPGNYEFTCRIVFQSEGGSITDHYEAGMRSEITVRP
jgi:uncharacterized cupredoxin-like copper-binding protein